MTLSQDSSSCSEVVCISTPLTDVAAGPEPSEAPKDCWSLLMGIAVEGFLGGLGFGVGLLGLGCLAGF